MVEVTVPYAGVARVEPLKHLPDFGIAAGVDPLVSGDGEARIGGEAA